MSLDRVPAGTPEEFNVVIEISMNSDPVKYEVDKESGVISVDRFMLAAMHYPANYGYIPQTLSKDGDPIDVLVITPFPVQTGAIIRCRVLGMLEMEDEAGEDAKLLAVPVDKIYLPYQRFKSYVDLPAEEIQRLQHFFESYKQLEPGKWVTVREWKGVEEAQAEIGRSVERYNVMLSRLDQSK